MKNKKQREDIIQWHPGFYSAMELTFKEDRDNLTFEREHPLSRKPLQMDLLVIHKNTDIPLKNPIGKIFKRYNIFEFKSPGDALNLDTLYKTMA